MGDLPSITDCNNKNNLLVVILGKSPIYLDWVLLM